MLAKRLRGMARYARFGYVGGALCKAVQEMELGLIDAYLGAQLVKKRIGRAGAGKSGGYRTLVSARVGSRYVFLHGFAKSDQSNISELERKALQFAGRVLLQLFDAPLQQALQSGALVKVNCGQHH